MALFRAVRALGSVSRPALALLGPSHAAAGAVAAAAAASVGPALGLGAVRHMSGSKLFVGGLAWEIDNNTLRDAFSSFGDVAEARVIVDRVTGRSRGFGFVQFSSEEDAQHALQGMDGKFLVGRTIRVDYASHRERPAGGGGGRRSGGQEYPDSPAGGGSESSSSSYGNF